MKRTLVLLNGCALLVLLITLGWGTQLYPQLPGTLTTHWDLSGTPDGFRPKTILVAFGPLLIGLGLSVLLSFLSFQLARSTSLVAAERRASGLALGWASLQTAAMFSWLGILSWRESAPGPLFIVFTLLGSLPLLVIFGLHVSDITRERRERAGKEPAYSRENWVMGGFLYRNPDDPRVFVPKPPHTGYGMTVNIATTGGRIFMWGIALLIIGPILVPVIISLSRSAG